MREIIHIPIGGCGINLQSDYQAKVNKDFGVDANGKCTQEDNYIDRFYEEKKKGFYVPRTVLVDTESSGLDEILNGTMGNLYTPDSMVVGRSGTGGIAAKGMYT